MLLSDFDFALPEDRIALRPVTPREAAKLLHVGPEGVLQDCHIADLPTLLRPGDVLVVNQSRVIPAALAAVRPARQPGGVDVAVHLNLVERLDDARWRAFAKPGRRLIVGDVLLVQGDITAEITDKAEDGRITLRFSVTGAVLDEALQRVGQMPLPPYIADRRPADAQDRVDYQTIYAADTGSVAAPTAGLHFTPELLAQLDAMGVTRLAVTLHVGAGTFLPVKVDDIATHQMHSEWGCVSADVAAAIRRAKAEGRRVVAVGTTAARILESAAQETGEIQAFSGDTAIFITPGFDFKVVDVLMTNFHLPKSTLFMLVSAFAGLDVMQRAYAHAIAARYRFYSYGDACLLERAS
jgi:S-adenosylmethionine:tRNA ribosyltransferase-isomerase